MVTHFDIITISETLWQIGTKPCDWQDGFHHSSDIVQLCLSSEFDYDPLWTESVFNCLMYFVLTKCVFISINNRLLPFFVFIRILFVLSLLAFCKPLDISSHFVLKIVCSVCDGFVSRHYTQTLRCYCILVTFVTLNNWVGIQNFSTLCLKCVCIIWTKWDRFMK